MKKRISFIKAIAAAVAAATAMTSCAVFAEAPAAEDSKVYENEIDFAADNGIMTGDDTGDLRLESEITRAEFVKMLLEAAKGDALDAAAGEAGSFSDTDGHWASEYIEKATACGFINGFEDGTFRPDEKVTFAQAVKMILAACGINTYAADYPFGYIGSAMDCGILDGVSAEPERNITRHDAVRLMYNAYNAVRDGELLLPYTDERYTNTENGYTIDTGYGLFEVSESYVIEDDAAADGSSWGTGSIAPPMGSGSTAGGGSASGNVSSGSVSGGAGGGVYGSIIGPDASSSGTYIYGNPYLSAEEYESYEPNGFKRTTLSPLSTFSIDTDTASYSNMRRFILNGSMPAANSIRTEELINYFSYDAPTPAEGEQFAAEAEITDCPWSDNKLARITVTGGTAESDKPSNLVFLIDVSGSMASYNKLPMLKKAMLILLDELGDEDTVSIITYSGSAGVVLEPTPCSEREVIADAIESLTPGGGTYGAAGLQLAYETIEEHKIDGNNRIILCSDGDFNIGPSSTDELKTLIETKRQAGIYLTTVGFGMGNYKDNRMELMADYGNGSYYYIDNMREAKRVFADEIDKTLYTVAEDVKLQVEFNPMVVSEYRLVGYENRQLAAEDFADDTVDAGELGSGAVVTAVYELVMSGGAPAGGGSSEYRYQTAQYNNSSEAFDIKIRYKEPGGSESILKEFPILNEETAPDADTNLAMAAAMLGLKLNGVIDAGYDTIAEMAEASMDTNDAAKAAERCEFVQLIDIMKYIDR